MKLINLFVLCRKKQIRDKEVKPLECVTIQSVTGELTNRSKQEAFKHKSKRVRNTSANVIVLYCVQLILQVNFCFTNTRNKHNVSDRLCKTIQYLLCICIEHMHGNINT